MALTKTRILSLLVLALALLNVCLLVLLWLSRSGPTRSARPGVSSVAAYVVHELDLTPRQQEQYKALRQQHQARMQHLLPALMARREELFSNLAQTAADTAAQPHLLDRIAALERSIDSLTYVHFVQVGRLVTPAQQPRWQQIAPTLPRMMQQVRRGRRGPPAQGQASEEGSRPPVGNRRAQ
ncbi:periplasmic heavy metal sensor [Hymenobacter negativus]|uniref:Periplasmic heavy metal sensor n=1 Tax=Hymenobacter negativus TaxID=2795026 RepID=A0ABS3QCU3_9BACT|nr:periplasmic heavy metal sensor [Hymenobacter negativus]MBO2009058.1 periplasmic heavy metal sensor [Hymenobacter negativus]